MGKPGRPPGRKTWHKTRGVKIAEAFQASRLFGLSTSDSKDDVATDFHIEPESVLRSFYRHKTEAALNVDEDEITQLALLMSALVDEILDEMPLRSACSVHGMTDVSLIKSTMLNAFLQIPAELRRRTKNLSSNPEAQELIDAWVTDFCEGFGGESDVSAPT